MAKRKTSSRKRKSSVLSGLGKMLKPKPKPKTAARKKPTRQTSKEPTGMSLDRKLDITGVVLAFFGVLTLFGLLSPDRSGIALAWVNLWRSAFGWGIYVFPLALIGIGAWLIARNFENVPRPDFERMLGVIILFILLLVVMHIFVSPADPAAARDLAFQGKGGGRIGAELMIFFEGGLGMLGLVLLVIAGGIIGLALALDTSVINLFTWVPPMVLRIQDAWDEHQAAAQGSPGRKDIPNLP